MSIREAMTAEVSGQDKTARGAQVSQPAELGVPDPVATREAALREAVARLRAATQVLAARAERLKATLASTRERYRRVVATRDTLKDRTGTLVARVRRLEAISREDREANARLRHKIADLERQLALAVSERKLDRRHGRLRPAEHNTPAGMDQFYDDPDNLRHFDDVIYRELAAALRRLLESEGITLEGRSLVDFGCGVGQVLRNLVEGASPAAIEGLDYSEAALRAARERLPGARFTRHDIYEPLGRLFDIALCTETLEHLAEPRRALANVLRSLAVDGVCLVTVPDGRSDVSLSHINFWSPESWPAFVAEAVAEAERGLRHRCETLHIGHARIAYNCAVIRRIA